MRLLHTADWHLGRSLGGHSLHEDQEYLFCGQFLDLVRLAQPDVVLIAGDVFHRRMPPVDAVNLLDEVLDRLIRHLGVKVVLIPGNHDDADRLAFGARLLAGGGLHIADSPVGRAWVFHDEHGPVSIVGVGYSSPLVLAQKLGNGATVADHDAGFGLLAPLLHGLCPPGQRRILVAHAFVAGGAESESERGLSVGGTGQISAARFAGFHYVALGHLHRPQSMLEGRLRYSGSPLAYSTSEAGQEKSVTLIEIDALGAVTTEALALAPLHPLRVVRGDFAELLRQGSGDYVSLELTDPQPVAEAQRRLAALYPRIIGLRWVTEAPSLGGLAVPGAALRAASPLAQFEAFHQAMRQGATLPEAARPVVVAAIESATRAEA